MGNYANTITTTCKGVDQTKGAFNSAAANASKFSQKLQGTMAGGAGKIGGIFSSISAGAMAATAAIGAVVMAVKKVISTAKEMSEITDRAKDAGLASGQIMKLTNAFSELGMKGASIDKTADIFQKMAKSGAGTTLADFGTLLRQVSELGTETERVTALTDIFGKANAEALAPLLRDGPEGVNQIFALGDSFATASETAMQAGDKFADTWNRICNTSKQGWYSFVGYLIKAFNTGTSETKSNVDSIGQKFVDIMGKIGLVTGTVVQVFVTLWQKATAKLQYYFATIGNAWNEFVSWFTGDDYEFGHYQFEIADEYNDRNTEIMNNMLARLDNVKKAWNEVGSATEKAKSSLAPALEDTEATINNVGKKTDKKPSILTNLFKTVDDAWNKLKSSTFNRYKSLKSSVEQKPKFIEPQLAGANEYGSHAAQVAEWKRNNPPISVENRQLQVEQDILNELRQHFLPLLVNGTNALKPLSTVNVY